MKAKTFLFIFTALAVALSLLGGAFAPSTVQAQQGSFVRVTHASPDAPNVDIYVNNEQNPIVANLAFGTASAILPIAPGTYTIRVRPAGDKQTTVFQAVVGVRPNEMLELVAQGIVGARGAQAFDIGVYRVSLAETGDQARVYVIHASPDAPAVDVRSGDTVLLRRLAFGQANTRSPLEVPAGSVPIQVVATGTTTAVIDATLDLAANRIYTIMAIDRLTSIKPLILQALPLRAAPAAAAPTGIVRVTHASADAPAVDIYLNNNRAIANLEFGKSTDLIELPAGAYNVAIRPAGAAANSTPVFQTALNVPANRTTEIVAMGLLAGSPDFMLGTYTIARSATNGKARIYLLHAAPKAPAVDVRANGQVVLQNVAYGTFTATPLEVAAGVTNIAATPAGRISPVVVRLTGPVDGLFDADTIYTVIAYGNPLREKPLVLKSAPVSEAAEGKTAAVRVIHVAKAPAVDVYLNDSPVAAITNLQAGKASDVVRLPTGEHKVQLRPAGQPSVNLPIFEKTISIGTNEWVEAVALGVFGGEPALDINTYKLDNAFPYGKVKIHALHAAPTAGAVDVIVNGQVAAQSVAFGDFTTEALTANPGITNIALTRPGTRSPVLAGLTGAPATYDANTVYTVVAFGDPINARLTAFPRTHEGNVRVIHASPDAPAVDVYVDGARAVANLAFTQASGFLSVPAGARKVAIRPAGAAADSAPVFETELNVPSGISAEVVALGKLAANFQLGVFPIDRNPLNGRARVYVIHAAPTTGAVDILVNGARVLEKVEFAKYNATALNVNPATYDIYVTDNARPGFFLVSLPKVRLEADTIYTVLAIGDPIRNEPLVLTSKQR
jgi:ribosomal protein S8E